MAFGIWQKTIILVLFIIFSNQTFGQNTHIFKLNKENLSRSSKNNEKLETIFDSNHSYSISNNNQFKKIKNENFPIIEIQTPDGNFKANLKKVPSPEYYYEHTEKGIDTIKLDNIIVLSGDLIGKNKGEMRIVLYNDGNIDGAVNINDKSYIFDYYSDQETGQYWINYYKSDEVKNKNETCGANSKSDQLSTINSDIKNKNAKIAGTCPIINIALEADYEFRQQHGVNAASKMISSINLSQGHVGSYNLKYRITSLNIWTTSSDPYTSTTNVNTLTTEFRNYWNLNRTYVPRDLAHLFTGRTPAGGLIGNTDVINAACTLPNSSYTISVLRASDAAFIASKWTTHEIGHFLGCEHTDAINCTNTNNFASVMCAIIQGNGIVWSSAESTKINNKLSSTSCFTVPNIRPTINCILYTGPVTISANTTVNLSLNHPIFSTGSTTSYTWFVTAPFMANGTYTPNGTSATASITNNYQITGQVTDDCGNIANNNFILNKATSFAGLNLYPNSVENYFDLFLPEITNLQFKNVKIYSEDGEQKHILKEMISLEPSLYRIKLEKHNNGLHYLHILHGGKIEKIRINLN